MKNNSMEAFTYSNMPERITLETYEAARKQLIKYVSRRQDVVSLYEFGSVRSPGISDLDFTVVISEDATSDIVNYLEEPRLPPLVLELMNGGTLMIMRADDFRHIRFWDNIDVIKRYGREIHLIEPAKEALANLEFCRLMDWLPERTARLLGFLRRSQCPIKRVIGILYSLRYSLLRLEQFLDQVDADFREFSDGISSLRAEWFEDSEVSTNRLVELLHEGIEVAFKAILYLNDHILEKAPYGTDAIVKKGALQLGKKLLFKFRGGTGKVKYVKFASLPLCEIDEIVLPSVFYHHFANYGLIGGPIGRQILANLSPQPINNQLEQVVPGLRKVLQRRMDVCNSLAMFLAEKGFQRGLFKFGWYYPYKS